MRDEFKKAWGDKALGEHGVREVLGSVTVEEINGSFETVEELLSLLTTASHSALPDAVVAEVRKAGVSPIGENGKPRVLKLTAVIAHSGPPNGNGDAFVREDLQEAVANDLFVAPYCGMVDFNHDFTPYGAWTSAKYVFDPVAQHHAIVAEGFVWAWRFQDLADKMMAAQARDGNMKVSMACMPRDIEYAQDASGRQYTVLRHPVFFTTSLLDVPPADKDGRAIGTEDPAQSAADRERALSVAAASTKELMEDNMTITELVAAFRSVVAEENRVQFDEIVAAALKLSETETKLASVLTELASAQESATTATEQLTALNATVATLTEEKATATARVAELEISVETLNGQVAELTTEVEPLRVAKAEAEKKAADDALAAAKDARLAELTEAARTVLASREESVRETLITRWVGMSDEEWGVIRDSLNVAKLNDKGKYETASAKEGPLASGAPSSGKKYRIDEFVK